jgi:hypothetical protein
LADKPSRAPDRADPWSSKSAEIYVIFAVSILGRAAFLIRLLGRQASTALVSTPQSLSLLFLLRHILEKREEYADAGAPEGADDDDIAKSRRHIKTSIENCWGKLDDYYQILNSLPVYMAALVMHPGHKLAFIERLWIGRTAWLANAKKGVKKLWENSYKGRYAGPTPTTALEGTPATTMTTTPHVEKAVDPFDQFMNPPGLYNMTSATVDEYRKYLEIPAHQCDIALAWWSDRHGIWPNLAVMAINVLSIPLMSAECERVFSEAGYFISGRRGHLQKDIIEATTCLRG